MLLHRRHTAMKKKMIVNQRIVTEKYCGTWQIWKQEIAPNSDSSSSFSKKVTSSKKLKSRSPEEEIKESQADDVPLASLNGTIFILERDKHVTWKVPQDVDNIPLFESKSFFVFQGSEKGRDRIEFELPYRGSMSLSCCITDDQLVLTYGKAEIHCHRGTNVDENPDRHSLAGALETTLFHDLQIVSRTGKEYNVHKCMFQAVFPNLDVVRCSELFSGLSNCLIDIIVSFVYTGLLSDDHPVDYLLELKSFCTQQTSLGVLTNAIEKCVERKSVKTKILALLTDCRTRLLRIASMINDCDQLDNEMDETHLANATRLVHVLKESFRELLPGIVMQLQMMYLYAVESKRMTKREKSTLIKEITEKAIEIKVALQSVVKVLYKQLNLLTPEELTKICKQGQPDVLKFIEEANLLFDSSCKPVFSGMVTRTNDKFKKEKAKKSGSKVLWVLKTALHTKELSKLRELEDVVKRVMVYFNQKREEFADMDYGIKAEFFSEVIEEDLPVYIKSLDNVKFFEDPTRSSGFRYLFNNVCSYMKWFLDIFVENKDEMNSLLEKVKRLVNREDFDKVVDDLLQLPVKTTKTFDDKKQEELYQNPVPVESVLPQCISNLYTSMKYADLEFIVRENSDTVSDSGTSVKILANCQEGDTEQAVNETVTSVKNPTNRQEDDANKNISRASANCQALASCQLDGFKQNLSKCVSSVKEPLSNVSESNSSQCTSTVKHLVNQQSDDACTQPLLSDDSESRIGTSLSYECILKAHGLIVCARCAWFRRALSSGMKEARERKFYIEDTSPSLFKIFIKYLYTFSADFTNVNTGDMMELMSIADRYENEEFKNECQSELQKNHISDESAIYILALAHNLGATDLKAAVLSYMSTSPQCCNSEDYAKLSEELKQEVHAKISSKTTEGEDGTHRHGKQREEDSRFSLSGSSSSSTSSSSLVDIDSISSPELTPRLDSAYSNSDLDECVQTLREIIDVPDDELVRLALAADNDSQRALNFHFQNQP